MPQYFLHFLLMFGREDKLPIELILEMCVRGTDSDWLWETKKKWEKSSVRSNIELN